MLMHKNHALWIMLSVCEFLHMSVLSVTINWTLLHHMHKMLAWLANI